MSNYWESAFWLTGVSKREKTIETMLQTRTARPVISRWMLDKAQAYGYKKVGFILDRGYFSKKNIESMDQCGYSFVIMVKGMASFIRQLITENKGSFEEEWANSISEYGVYGKTVKRKLYAADEKDRYFHLYYNSARASKEKREIKSKISEMKRFLLNHTNEKRIFGPAYGKYFTLHYDTDGETFLFPEDKIKAVSAELKLCGYFAIVTSEKMSAKEAINLYKSRDASEKLDQKPNYMTVPAAIRELEKIEMVRQLDRYLIVHIQAVIIQPAESCHRKAMAEAV